MIRNIDIALLRAFVAIVDQGSLSAAARALHLTQGAISQQLARLEALLDQRLLWRDHRGARLAPKGESLIATAREMIALNDRMWRDLGSPRHRVRLGAPPDVISEILPPLLRAFAKASPETEVSLISAPSALLGKALADGMVDLALVQHEPGTEGGTPLFREALVWVGAAEGTAWRQEPLPVSISHPTCRFRSPIAAALNEAGRAWRPAFDNEGFEAMITAIRADLAITAAMASMVPAGLGMVADQALPALPVFEISLLMPPEPGPRPVMQLASLIADGLRARPRGDGPGVPAGSGKGLLPARPA
ncbi:LysR family transcriptional regulator [Novosphingobium rosa]|uniref:LysR family transcriptional regulator n=1 Tax=Novosphingobium rosa TaxID=76978 RepID=UPI0008301C69|nr:LysR substrate-binding domain-containing protein [Novosphingobium rosa]